MLEAIFFVFFVGSVGDVSVFFSWVSGLQVCNAGGYLFSFVGSVGNVSAFFVPAIS